MNWEPASVRMRSRVVSSISKASGLSDLDSDAMMSLKAGDVTPAPVKTQFGFHVIKLEETRD